MFSLFRTYVGCCKLKTVQLIVPSLAIVGYAYYNQFKNFLFIISKKSINLELHFIVFSVFLRFQDVWILFMTVDRKSEQRLSNHYLVLKLSRHLVLSVNLIQTFWFLLVNKCSYLCQSELIEHFVLSVCLSFSFFLFSV